MKSALIIVDMQNDFLPGGVLPVKDADQIVPIINQIQASFDLVIAIKDYHPKNHISFAETQKLPVGQVIYLAGTKQILWPSHCVQKTWGSEFAPGLDQSKISKIFYKGTDPLVDSYSCFFDNERRKDTGLNKYLKEQGVKKVYLVGVATEYCVLFSALHAKELGYEVFVILDACRGINLNASDIHQAVEKMKEKGVAILAGTELSVSQKGLKN